MTNQTRRIVIVWLALCCLLIFIMVLLGGAVRLTDSGLSMVDWRPIMGVFPPLNDIAWRQVFEQYQQFPEFKIVHTQMDLQKFKFIYLMEYSHRMLGRLIGLIFVLPFIYFVVARKISSTLAFKLGLLLVMGAVQGGMGWYMVRSGLVDNPQVSQYRLVLHLLIAVIIYAYMLKILSELLPIPSVHPPRVQKFGVVLIGVILLMIASGGFVAGTHAGFIYNTFPTMGGEWMPSQVSSLTPIWLNLFENPVAIQFFHRLMAMLVFGLVVIYAFMLMGRSRPAYQQGWRIFISLGLLIAVFLQVGLGIATLLAGVPAVLGVAHQAGALILLTMAVIAVASNQTIPSKRAIT